MGVPGNQQSFDQHNTFCLVVGGDCQSVVGFARSAIWPYRIGTLDIWEVYSWQWPEAGQCLYVQDFGLRQNACVQVIHANLRAAIGWLLNLYIPLVWSGIVEEKRADQSEL